MQSTETLVRAEGEVLRTGFTNEPLNSDCGTSLYNDFC